ncbi:hypothetical protein C7374_105189 [Falsochrobactrum ovis]|uniref:Uncharacterized protein n=1 Tax=Falsochrobactrum ovis TaxID=1293442 RepID=A0A364JVQ7_9HYPH|nr:hypothetical protein C7374_105189 [Falsochrobactrum ovis]
MNEAILLGIFMLGLLSGAWIACLLGVWNMRSGSTTKDEAPWGRP